MNVFELALAEIKESEVDRTDIAVPEIQFPP